MPLNQVALATDGGSSMTGHHMGLAARMHAEVPTLIHVHCIVHREVFVVGNALIVFFKEFQKWDRFVDCSTNWRNELK